jgi:2,3-bisphosphoglycerate-dependent phosphoglycerate mutase
MHTTIWLTRHGESADPTVFHGAESDVELSDHGQAQAVAAAGWFREQQPTLVVSSAMRRAIDTASPTATTANLRHVIIPELHERRVGPMCGMKFNLVEGPWADTLREWQAGNTAFTTAGAESFDELRHRLVAAFERIASEWAGERILIVSHGVVCKVLLLCLLEGGAARRWSELGRVENLAVSELVGSPANGWKATRLLELPEPVAQLNHLARLRANTVRSEG